MTTIQILGSGCPKCKKLAEETEKAAKAMGIEYQIEKVSEMDKILAFSVMMTPALVVNGVVKVSGRVPGQDDLKKMLAS